MQFEREINIYSDEAILKRFQANETSISVVQGKISALISESELIELENSNATMYSKLASAVLDIDSLNVNFSELNTKYNTVSGQYTELNSKVANYKASVDGISANLTQVSQNLSKNYSTTTQMNSAINAKANEISADISAVETNLNNNYSTTTKMNAAIRAAADGVSSEVSAVNTKLENNYSTTTKVSTMISQSARDLRVEIQNAENNAKKVATNFLSYDATNGLLIGNKQNGSWQGFRSQITSSAFNILNSSGTQIASYGASTIELGKNSENSIIKLCGGKGQLKYTKNIQSIEYSGTKYNALEMISENIVLSSSDLETHIRNNGRRNGTNEDGRYVNSYVLCEKYKTKIGYRSGASSSSYDQQSSITVNDNMISIDSNGRAEINCKDFEIVSDGDIYLSTTENKGNIYLNHRRFDVNVLLWAGSWYMTSNHTANLGEKISNQKNGVVLIFNYFNGAVTTQSWHAFFIPKYAIEIGNGMPWDFWMGQSNFAKVCGKGLYIYDDHITGADVNAQAGTSNGITYDNDTYVLRYVVGV